MNFIFPRVAAGVSRFCNPPVRSTRPEGVCMACLCRRWKETVSTFDIDRPSTRLQAILAAQVDCRIPTMRIVTGMELVHPGAKCFPTLKLAAVERQEFMLTNFKTASQIKLLILQDLPTDMSGQSKHRYYENYKNRYRCNDCSSHADRRVML